MDKLKGFASKAKEKGSAVAAAAKEKGSAAAGVAMEKAKQSAASAKEKVNEKRAEIGQSGARVARFLAKTAGPIPNVESQSYDSSLFPLRDGWCSRRGDAEHVPFADGTD